MESTIAQKVDALSKLQSIDSQMDEILRVRGDLPEEVQDLEDEIAGYETRISKFEAELESLEEGIRTYKANIKDFEKRIQRLEEQQMEVRNNREYDAITKEMETLDLDIQVSQKKIREAKVAIDAKQAQITTTSDVLNERKSDLDVKKSELQEIIADTEVEEQKLLKQREKAEKALEDRLLKAYKKIRDNSINGLAVVPVKRGACGGCFNMVPPQRQSDIKERKKLIVCEHCGRILADVIVEEVPEEAPKKKTTRRKKAAK